MATSHISGPLIIGPTGVAAAAATHITLDASGAASLPGALTIGGALTVTGGITEKATVRLFDDFMGDSVDARWSAAVGSDPQCIIATVNSGASSGSVRLTSGDTTTVAESLSSLTHGLNWKAANGGLVFETKVTPVTSVANVSYWIGLTDSLATGTLESPATLATTTITYVADDAIGFLFDTGATSKVWVGAGVKATTGVALANCAKGTAAPVADTATVLRIEVSATGTATFYVDGVLLGSVANAVTAATALTPIVAVMARTTTSKAIDVDYVLVQQTR